MAYAVHDRVTGKRIGVRRARRSSPFSSSSSAAAGVGASLGGDRDDDDGKVLCDADSPCRMRNVRNPLTAELGLYNIFSCVRCYRVHLCDMRHDCRLVSTQEGNVCCKTGLAYDCVLAGQRVDASEPVVEPNAEDVNVVGVILSYVYAYLVKHSDHYADVIEEVTEDGGFKKSVESAIYFTFNRVFKKANLHKVPLAVVGQLFIQLIIGVHAKATKYDSTVIKVSRRKREDNLLKQMRCEYGNAPVFRPRF